MKVLLLSNKVPYPANDGSSIAMRSMVEALRQNKASVQVMALNTLKHHRSKSDIQKHRPKDVELEVFEANTNITVAGLLSNLIEGSPYHVSRFYQENFAEALRQKLKSQPFDIIQVEGLPMAVYLPVIRKFSDAKVVLRAHNLEQIIWLRHLQHERHPLKRNYLKLQVKRLTEFENRVLKDVDATVFITEMDREEYLKRDGQKPAIAIPCGLNVEEYSQDDPEPDFDLSYLASFDWLPNQQGFEWFMKEVWPLVKKEKPDATFALGGHGMSTNFRQFKESGVTLFQEVENAHQFIKRGRLVVIPLLAGSGMRIKIIENMALGCPMVSTSVGAEGIKISPEKDIVLADLPFQFAKAILHLLDHPQKRRQMGKLARKNIEQQYTNVHLGKKLLEFYLQL